MEIQRRRGLPSGRAVLGGVLMASAGVGVFAAYASAGRSTLDPVVVARGPIRAGQVVERDDVEVIEVDLGSSALQAFHRIDEVAGKMALGPIDAGELLQAGSLASDARDAGLHEVAITLPRSHVAASRLKAGERVDVFVTFDDRTRTVARAVEIVDLADDDGSLTSEREVTVVVAVSGGEAVAAIVHGLRTGDVTLVRSAVGTGATAPPLDHDERGEGAEASGGTG